MITTVLCYSATLGIAVTVYDTPCRVDMGNVGYTQYEHRQAYAKTTALNRLLRNLCTLKSSDGSL